ncbi:MAG: type II toxin-antitoxin system mRNA interferase toxin, RelE/StbE family [Nitrospiraceae bacterium]|nr:type II toxin-antitoxin system mRNA interferase toxin, RelE/StbE family [Nitrospiraceae bacterium]
MASYQIEWKRSALKEFRRLPASVQRRVFQAIEKLAENPYPHGGVKLTGSTRSYRLRVGDYRVVYTVESALLRIEIVRIRHRRDVYR